jgi:hypothetical protein
VTIGDMAWCPRCHRRRTVIDEHRESNYDGGSEGAREYGYTVRNLDCDHEVSTSPSIVGSAPGAPYAGRPTTTIRASDLAASRRTEETE